MRLAKAIGPLAAEELVALHDLLNLDIGVDRLLHLVNDTLNHLDPGAAGHLRLLLRLSGEEETARNLTGRRELAEARGLASDHGGTRGWQENFDLSQLVVGVLRRVKEGAAGGQGYDIDAASFRYWFEDDDPDQFRVDASFELTTTRNDVRVFTFGTEPTGGTPSTPICLSEDEGHALLGEVPVNPTKPSGPRYAFFYLGGNLRIGTPVTLKLRQSWDSVGEGAIREHGTAPVSGGGPLTIVLDAPASIVSHYAAFAQPYWTPHQPPHSALVQREGDDPIVISESNPNRDFNYGFWFRVVPKTA